MPVHANIEPLLWESEFFQLKCAKLHFSHTAPPVHLADLQPWALVQAKVPAHCLGDIDALSKLGFQLAEGEINFSLMPGADHAAAVLADNINNSLIRPAVKSDIPLLHRCATHVFVFSRFRAPWYNERDSGRFYATWIEKAVLGTFDDQCLLALNEKGQPPGFVTLRATAQTEACLGLFAVFPDARGQGVGRRLIQAAKQWCLQQRRHPLGITTQLSNIAAIRLFISSGAMAESTAYWLYRGQNDSI